MAGPVIQITCADVRQIEATAIDIHPRGCVAVEILTTDCCGTTTEITLHLPPALADRAEGIVAAINTAPVAAAAA